MNKQEYTATIWADADLTARIATEHGIKTLSGLRKLKREAIEAMVAAFDEPVQHSVVPSKYRATYVRGKSSSGKSTLSNGDKVARALAGMTPEQVCRIADGAFGLPFGTHEAKYAHLNAGMQRMNAGNRVRNLIVKRNAA